MKIRTSVILVFYFLYFANAANILILEEIPSPSHHLWFKTISAALATKGYNITVVSGENDTSVDNIHYIYMDKVYATIYTGGDGVADELNFFDFGGDGIFSQLLSGGKFSLAICNGFLKSTGWEQLRKYPDHFKFDLIIHDHLLGGCLLNFIQKFNNPPLISMTAFNDIVVLPYLAQMSVIPALNPYPTLESFPTTFKDRVTNVLLHLADRVLYSWYIGPKLTSMVQKSNTFNSTMSVIDLSRRTILYVINYDPAVDGPRQLPPNVIGVGGLQMTDKKALPDELQLIVNNSLDGIVLFSLGTNIQSEQLGNDIIAGILDVFSKFPNYTFLWQIDLKKSPVPLPQNVFVKPWIPENDILAQNKTKLFITHAGLLSTQRAIWHGVPMLGIPLFADQFSNIHKSVDKGIADFLHIDDLTKQNLYTKLQSMLTSSTFYDKIQITSKAFKDQKESPLERALWWIEWAIRNPNVTHFSSNGRNLNFVQIESIDVYAFLTIIVSTIVWITLWILFKIFGLIYHTSPSSTKLRKSIGKKKKQK